MQEKISLYFCENGSDKEYHVQLVETPVDLWLVNFQYGRRGNALSTGTKTAVALPYPNAKIVYDKLVNEKVKKGYSTGQEGTAYAGTNLENRSTGIFPQLLNEIPESEVENYIRDDNWIMEEKFDGNRGMVKKDDAVIGINRKSLEVGLPVNLVEAVTVLGRSVILDGERIGDKLYVFDCLSIDDKDIKPKGYLDRRSLASALLAQLPANSGFIDIYTARTTEEKRALFAKVKQENGEGVVFKLKNSTYEPGRPASGGDQLKFKFCASATVIVIKANSGKRSVNIGVLDKAQVVVAVGNVTIPANYDIPKAGQLVEVKYLYAYLGGSLFQPVYQGVRTDIAYEACTQTQLKYKAGTESDEDEG